MAGAPDRLETMPQQTVGRWVDGKIVLKVSGSRDISDFVRGNYNSLAEVDSVTTDDGLKINYTGTGNFTLTSPEAQIIREFLKDKKFNVGSRIFKQGAHVPLPDLNS